MNPLLTAAEVADALHMSSQVVLRWKRAGIIPAAIDRHRFVRFDLAAVRRQLAAKPSKKQNNGMVPTY